MHANGINSKVIILASIRYIICNFWIYETIVMNFASFNIKIIQLIGGSKISVSKQCTSDIFEISTFFWSKNISNMFYFDLRNKSY